MGGIYRQRHLEHTVFYRVFFYYFERFLREYEDRFEKEYGYFRPVIQEVVEKYLDCGNPMCGFARIRCPDCEEERLLMFSCKTRGSLSIVSCQAPGRMGRVDAGGTSSGCPSPSGGLHRAQDAAFVFPLQAKAPQFALSLCSANTGEIPV